jgi:heptosyltransferase I
VHNLKVGLKADVDWVVQSEYVELVRCFTDVDRIIPFHRKAFFSNWRRFMGDLRKQEYDLIVDLQGLLKSAMVTRLARGKRRIGPSFHREGAGFFYDAVAGAQDKNRHAVEENLDVVRYLGLTPLKPEFPVRFPVQPVAARRPRVALLPTSRWQTKNWPVRCFVDVGMRLLKAKDVSLFILGGPTDASVCAELELGLGRKATNVAGTLSFSETGGLLREMDLLISNDSGPVHMAAAVGTPTLVVFGPTDPKRTGPYGDGHRIASVKLPCQPCFSRTCHRDGVPCLSGVTPEHVTEMALEMLNHR